MLVHAHIIRLLPVWSREKEWSRNGVGVLTRQARTSHLVPAKTAFLGRYRQYFPENSLRTVATRHPQSTPLPHGCYPHWGFLHGGDT